MKIRPEASEDDRKIRKLLIDAFGRPDEADLVAALRRDGAVAQALVAEVEGEIVGYLMLSHLDAPFSACALAPLAVAPMWQRQGIGAALIEAIDTGCDAIFVLGDPAYYSRFGFSTDLATGYACAFAGPFFMVKPQAEIPATGRIFYPQAFAAL
ncbi:GNAT family N-acetyltransferase [Falsirhodobacter deserti]|uniref:GNAT family N-acetyltransferase n=1 Tax=Falsirhodobacter deserti TaxID=1365611 RepID=UPI000FE32638|nr:N-acetyltransferase [Falsirhodobacter deserti]